MFGYIRVIFVSMKMWPPKNVGQFFKLLKMAIEMHKSTLMESKLSKKSPGKWTDLKGRK